MGCILNHAHLLRRLLISITMVSPDITTFRTIDDGAEELFGGFWPFLKRTLLIFLPLWTWLLCWSAGFNNIISATLAGLSLSVIVGIERYKLSRTPSKDN
jgi:hypothetical protein